MSIRGNHGFPRNTSGRLPILRVPVSLMALALSACSATSPTTAPSAAPSSSAGVTSTTPVPASSRTLEVPAHLGPAIDGVLEVGEWEGAAEMSMSNGSTVRSVFDDEMLYVSVDSGRIGAVNLAIATNDEIWILHSSAALGSALYVPGATAWELSHGFEWCCRISTDESERRSLLEDEGWQANIGFTGDAGVVEFQVALPWVDAAMAISFVTETDNPAFWPTDLSPIAQQQLIGLRQSEVEFRLEEWYLIVPTDG